MRGRSPIGRAGWLFGALVLAWGFNYLFVRWGLAVAPALWLSAGRALVGAAGVLTFTGSTGRLGVLDRRGRRDALLLGLPTTATFFGLWFSAAGSVPPGTTAVLVYTYPLWVVLVSALWLHERLSAGALLAVLAGFIGVVLVSEPFGRSAGGLPPLALVELLAAAIAWAVGTIGFKRRFTGAEVQEANAFQLLGGGLALLAASIWLEPRGVALSPTFVGVLLWLGLVGTAFAYAVWYDLLDRYPATTLSAYVFLVPLVALVASLVLFQEQILPLQLLGIVLVLLSLIGTARYSAPSDALRSTRLPPAD